MKKLLENIEIKYSKADLAYIEELLIYLKENKEEIYNFFGIHPTKRIEINIVPTKQELNNIFLELIKYECKDWVVGFVYCSKEFYRIYILSYSDYKNTVHYKESFEDYRKTFIHEFIHVINAIFSNCLFPITPLWEGIAIFLSKQHFEETEITSTEEDILNGNASFKDYYNLFLKIIKTYSHNDVLKMLDTSINGESIIKEVLNHHKSIL